MAAATLTPRAAKLSCLSNSRKQLTLIPCKHYIMHTTCWSSTSQNGPSAAADMVAIIEDAEQQQSSPADPTPKLYPQPERRLSSGNPKEPLYKALLAIILKLSELKQNGQQEQQQDQSKQHQQDGEQQQQLEAFLRSQPIATSIPFISWLADLEAAATGPRKSQLAALCEFLVMFRELQDREGQEQLYRETLQLLSGGDENVSALMSAEPRQYALALAEGLTGEPLALQGYSPAVNILLQVAPSAALTPEAVAQGHALAEELGRDLTSRRRSTLAAMMGRTRLTPEQQQQLMGGTPASRICDLLLTLGSSAERIALLPDCFTPPAELEDDATGAGSSSAAAEEQQQQQQQQGEEDQETEELWCTPMQLLNEIEARLKSAASAAANIEASSSSIRQALGPGSSSSSGMPIGDIQMQQQQQLPEASSAAAAAASDGPEGMLVGDAAVAALRELRDHIANCWLESLPQSSTRAEQQ